MDFCELEGFQPRLNAMSRSGNLAYIMLYPEQGKCDHVLTCQLADHSRVKSISPLYCVLCIILSSIRISRESLGAHLIGAIT